LSEINILKGTLKRYEKLLKRLREIKLIAATPILIAGAVMISAQTGPNIGFFQFVENRKPNVAGQAVSESKSGSAFENICPAASNAAARKVLTEYGAIFSASEMVVVPPVCIFRDDAEVFAFHAALPIRTINFGSVAINLQQAAAESLRAVVDEASASGVNIRPLDGSIAGGRNYAETVRLWNSRFVPALHFWSERGSISSDEAESVVSQPFLKQVEKVIEWESRGLLFGTNRNGSIFSSVAPPGTSQHLSLLAFDIAPPITPTVIALMRSHGWYQTVRGDKPHDLLDTEYPCSRDQPIKFTAAG
jgi:hypothetical protein